MNLILPALLGMGGTALVLSLLLYYISRKFHVHEDPRIGEVEAMLPGVNCGACGFPGCSGLAKAFVRQADSGGSESLFCPPGGQGVMDMVATHLGISPTQGQKKVAVLHCGGSRTASPSRVHYAGSPNCTISSGLFSGEGGCAYGCLGFGECVASCSFDAMYMDTQTGLPVILADRCTACGACVKACPRSLISLEPWGSQGRRVWVNCRNLERGAIARKNCQTACIACGKCEKVCQTIALAITIENNVARIDPEKCISCGKCVGECPTKAILATFPVKTAQAKEAVE